MLSQHLPLGESAGVFFGINGIEWLAMGYAEPMRALAIAGAFGTLLFLHRRQVRARSARQAARPGDTRS